VQFSAGKGYRVPRSRTVMRLSYLSYCGGTAVDALCQLKYSPLLHNTTIVLWPFVQEYPGEPVPEETFTHRHPDHHPIFISFFHLPRSIASGTFFHSILPVQIACLAIFLHNLSPLLHNCTKIPFEKACSWCMTLTIVTAIIP